MSDKNCIGESRGHLNLRDNDLPPSANSESSIHGIGHGHVGFSISCPSPCAQKWEAGAMTPGTELSRTPTLAVGGSGQDYCQDDKHDEIVLSKTRMVLLAMGMMLTYFLGTASSTSVTMIIPQMARDLEVSELEAQWVVSAYSLAYGCGLLFAGRLADLYGRKILYIGGLCTFCILSIISALVRQRIALCVIRALCGLGLAVASPAGFGIIGVSFRKEPERTIAFAAFGLGAPVGAAMGSILGGAVADVGRRGWSYLFYILAGAAVIPIVLGIIVVPRDRRLRDANQDRRIDWLGGFLVTAGLCLFTFSITESGISPDGWRTPYVPALLVVSLVLLVLFALWERWLELHSTLPPIAKFSIFTRHRYKVSVVLAASFLISLSVYGWVYLSAVWYQTYKGLSALQCAIRLLPANIVGVLAAASAMWLGPRYRAPWLIIGGCIASSLTAILFASQPEGTSYWACEFIANALLPWGIDLTVCLGNVMVSNLVTEDEQSVGGALFQTSLQIGAGLAICFTSLVSTTRSEQTGSLVSGLRAAFWMCAAFALFVPVLVFLGLRKVGLAKDVAKVDQ